MKITNFNSFSKALPKSLELQEELCTFTSFLNSSYDIVPYQQRMYHIKHLLNDVQKCESCSSPLRWKPYHAGYYIDCGSPGCILLSNKKKLAKQWASMTEESKQKRRERWKASKIKGNLERYGVEWHNQTEDWKEKVKATSMKNFGVDHYSKTEECQNRKKITCLEKYGVDCVTKNEKVKEKGRNTCMEKYGVENPLQSQKIKDKVKKTNQERYGVDWVTQTDNFISKSGDTTCNRSSYRRKEYVLPSGRIIKVQGYEDRALNILLKTHSEEEIAYSFSEIADEIGKIQYVGLDDKSHRYLPDLYVKSKKLIIEVKSGFTFNSSKKLNLLKRQACLDAGFNFEFMIL